MRTSLKFAFAAALLACAPSAIAQQTRVEAGVIDCRGTTAAFIVGCKSSDSSGGAASGTGIRMAGILISHAMDDVAFFDRQYSAPWRRTKKNAARRLRFSEANVA